jgi:hypothetical protein
MTSQVIRDVGAVYHAERPSAAGKCVIIAGRPAAVWRAAGPATLGVTLRRLGRYDREILLVIDTCVDYEEYDDRSSSGR